MPAAGIWKEHFRVRSYETDPSGRITVASICNYLQEAAGNHAFRLGLSVEHLQDRHLTWVLSRLRVRVDEYAQWRDEIAVETWPSGREGLVATRDFLLLDAEGRTLGRATSGWMMIDMERRRPARLPDLVESLELPDRERAIADTSSTLAKPAAENGSHDESGSHEVRVQYHDLDVNGHVNNVRYVEWALEALPVGMLESHDLTELEIHFRAEAFYGDTVLARAAALDGSSEFAHVIMQNGGEKELARLRTTWRMR